MPKLLKSLSLYIVATLLGIGTLVFAGTNFAPSATPNPTMYSLEDLYQRLQDNNYSPSSHLLTNTNLPLASMHDLSDIYGSITPFYNTAFSLGSSTGYSLGYNDGISVGSTTGYTTGYNDGLATNPISNNVRSGISFGNGQIGNIVLPNISNVLVGTNYGANGTEYTGTLPSPSYPSENNVLNGITYGDNGSGFTGNVTLPSAASVISTATFGPNSSTAGTYDVSNLSEGNVTSGVSYGNGQTGSAVGASGDAVASNVLSGKTFSNSTSSGITGTMTNNGTVNITPSTTNQSIAAGYHSGSGVVYGDTNLIPGNIVSGITIFGVLGTSTTGTYDVSNLTENNVIAGISYGNSQTGTAVRALGNAVAGNVLTGTTFSNATTSNISGTMTNNGTVNITPSTSNQSITAGYHSGSGVVYGDIDLTASNIISTANLFGVAGNVVLPSAASVISTATFGPNSGTTGTYNVANLSVGNVVSGISYGNSQTGTAIKALGNAVAGNVLTGTTFSNASAANVSGTMANNGTVNITPGTSNQSIAAGYHSGSGVVSGDTDLAAGNILSGINIFGVAGNVIKALGNATAANVLTGTTFSNASAANVSGTMANNGTVNITPSTSNQSIAVGYHSGSGVVYGDTDLTAANIKSGVNMFGVVGTYPSTEWYGSDYPGYTDWTTGYSYCNGLSTSGGLKPGVKWRLPTKTELIAKWNETGTNPAPGFQSVGNGYWADTAFYGGSLAVAVYMTLGLSVGGPMANADRYVRCAR